MKLNHQNGTGSRQLDQIQLRFEGDGEGALGADEEMSEIARTIFLPSPPKRGRGEIVQFGSLRFSQNQIHNPASFDVCDWLPAVAQKGGIRAAGFFKSIAQNRHPVESSFFVDGLR